MLLAGGIETVGVVGVPLLNSGEISVILFIPAVIVLVDTAADTVVWLAPNQS